MQQYQSRNQSCIQVVAMRQAAPYLLRLRLWVIVSRIARFFGAPAIVLESSLPNDEKP